MIYRSLFIIISLLMFLTHSVAGTITIKATKNTLIFPFPMPLNVKSWKLQ